MKLIRKALEFVSDVHSVLRTTPDNKFNMRYWHLTLSGRQVKELNCGFVACAIGHAAYDPEVSKKYNLIIRNNQPLVVIDSPLYGKSHLREFVATDYLMQLHNRPEGEGTELGLSLSTYLFANSAYPEVWSTKDGVYRPCGTAPKSSVLTRLQQVTALLIALSVLIPDNETITEKLDIPPTDKAGGDGGVELYKRIILADLLYLANTDDVLDIP